MPLRVPGAIVVVLMAVAVWTASGRAEPTTAPVSFRLIVTDAHGHSIRNLKAPEIEIAEAGTTKKASSVVFRDRSPRRIAFYLDEYHVSPGTNTERTRAAIARFVERHIGTDDSIVVMKPLDPRAATAAVPGIEAVHRKLSEFDGRRGVFEPRSDFEAQHMSSSPAAAERERAQVVRAGLETLAIAMREEDAPATALVVVTEGFASEESPRMRTTTLRTIARAARFANVPVYIIDPSLAVASEPVFDDSWQALSQQTGGLLFPAGSDLDVALARVAADLGAHYLVQFEGAGREDGRFHDIEVKVRRTGAQVRAPSGYWAPFAESRLPSTTPRTNYARLLTPHVSGLIQPWFRMAPAADGQTRVTFSWIPRPGRKTAPERVELSAMTFQGETIHTATTAPLPGAGRATETSFLVAPGPLQISLAITASRLLDTDVRYIDVPKLDAARPYIAAVEFVRPRSLPELRAMQSDASAMPTEVREFQRQDRLLVRVRAFAAGLPDVKVALLNRAGDVLLELTRLQPVDGAAQFDLPFARFTRGEYRLRIRASSGAEVVTNLVTIRLTG